MTEKYTESYDPNELFDESSYYKPTTGFITGMSILEKAHKDAKIERYFVESPGYKGGYDPIKPYEPDNPPKLEKLFAESAKKSEKDKNPLKYFEYKHLPAELRVVSAQFYNLALFIVNEVQDSEQRQIALQKLLEAKDAAVRAAL